VFRPLYQRSHLDQVLATFGLILFLNQGVKMLFGASPLNVPVPTWFEGSILLGDGILYPLYRFVIIAAGLLVGLLLWVMVEKTRIGMQLRAGASHPDMLSALGVDVKKLFMYIFAFGSVLAGFAGAMAAPILSVEPGMGDQVLILAFVVIVIGGIGSIRGAFAGALLVGLIDTLARSYMVDVLRLFTGAAAARGIANGLSSMFIYVLMAVVLFLRPEGLFPARGRS
jgi:branched-chain amino acid transport system permease protein